MDDQTVRDIKLTPRVEQAVRLYALGKYKTQVEAAASCEVHPNWFCQVLKSPAGQEVYNQVRNELDQRLENLYDKFIDTIEAGFDDNDIKNRLACAKIYAGTNLGNKVKLEVSAEDLVAQIMSGKYVPPSEED